MVVMTDVGPMMPRGLSGFSSQWEHKIATVSDVVDGHLLRILVDGNQFSYSFTETEMVELVQRHHPYCGECGELWPCRHQRQYAEEALLLHKLEDVCAHCGQMIGGSWNASINDGAVRRRYHIAKKYRAGGMRCADALEADRKHLSEHGVLRPVSGGVR